MNDSPPPALQASAAEAPHTKIPAPLSLSERLKAVYESAKYYCALLLLIGGLPLAINEFDERLGIGNLWFAALIFAAPAIVLLSWIAGAWYSHRNRQWAIDCGIRGEIHHADYFRLTAYDAQTEYRRADNAHLIVHQWITRSPASLLYLSGVSGCGKSSIVFGWMLPMIDAQSDGCMAIAIRTGSAPAQSVRSALLRERVIWRTPPADASLDIRDLLVRAAKRPQVKKILLVLDQFEEFLIQEEDEAKREFSALLRSLVTVPIPRLQLLLVLRSDYRPLLESLQLPTSPDDHKEVPAFFERDAVRFLRDSRLQLSPTLEREILAEAREIEQTPGLIRPITINLFGLMLRRFQTLPSNYKQGTLLRSYLRELIQRPGLQELAPTLLRLMLTANGTRKQISVGTASQLTGFDAKQIRGCLITLANDGVVRSLDATHQEWEISHDFIATLYQSVLAAWRVSAWRAVRPWALGVAVAISVASSAAVPVLMQQQVESAAVDVLLAQGFTTTSCAENPIFDTDFNSYTKSPDEVDCLGIVARDIGKVYLEVALAELQKLKKHDHMILVGKADSLVSYSTARLPNLLGLELQESVTPDLQGLKHAPNLRWLSVSRGEYHGTRLVEPLQIEGLEYLAHLERLQLIGRVRDYRPIANVRTLEWLALHDSGLNDLPPLKNLTGLRWLSLSGTSVSNVDALRGLKKLEVIDLSQTPHLDNLSGLSGQTSVRVLNLWSSAVGSLAGLDTLTGLKQLDLRDVTMKNLAGVRGLAALETLLFAGAQVKDMAALASLTGLRKLDASNSTLSDLRPLGNMKKLEELNLDSLSEQHGLDLRPLAGLPALRELSVKAVRPVRYLAALKAAKNLKHLDLSGSEYDQQDLAELRQSLPGLVVDDLPPPQPPDA